MRQPSIVTSCVAAKGERESHRVGEPLRRIPERDAGERQHDGNLRDNDPAAAAAQKRAEDRGVIFFEERRPDEFELVSDGELAHEPDRLDRNFGLGQPGGLRDIHKQKRDSRAEAEPQHGGVTPVGPQMGEEGCFFGIVSHSGQFSASCF
jgi:hypothetical protein